jgi:zinc protease
MFDGSAHVPFGKFDEWLEAVGGDNNASTAEDRTNYFEDIPSNALELPLFLESDRMGYLLDAMTPEKVDQQRDVVKNERRQRVDNQPYGKAFIVINENLYAPDFPYHWPVIGSMEDLTAASYQDVVDFFKKYYSTANATLVVAGDIDPQKTKSLVEKWFSDVKPGKPVPPMGTPVSYLEEEKRIVMEDRVQLPRLYITWHILAGGKNSRLYKRLVYDMQIAQDVSAGQSSNMLSSEFGIVATARSGHTLTELEKVIREEVQKLKDSPPTQREVQRAVNEFEASFLDRLESISGKADMLNSYFMETGNPDYFNEDFQRYKAIAPDDVQSMTQTYLRDNGDVVLSVVPEGKKDLAASPSKREGGK